MQPIFVSYASENRAFASDRAVFDQFLEALQNEVGQNMGVARDGVIFLAHRDIETGDEWTEELAQALCSARVMLSFFSSHYFNSRWCGREFEVFRRRRLDWIAAHPGQSASTAIVPVQWIVTPGAPDVTTVFQITDASFPQAYKDLGLRKLLQLDRTSEWMLVMTALAKRVQKALSEAALPPLARLAPVNELPSAFHAAPASAPQQARQQQLPVNAACFVFVAATQAEIAPARLNASAWGETDGWDWRPFYPQSPESVGALAQRAAGDRNLRFVQLPCDDQLMGRLREAKRARLPVVIFADPWSACLRPYRDLLVDYDDLNLLNCAVLVPWNRDDPETVREKAGLLANLRAACVQKMEQKYPGHHWDISNTDDFRSRVQTVLDEITLRMLDVAGLADMRRAESVELAEAARLQGIETSAQPQVNAVPRTEFSGDVP